MTRSGFRSAGRSLFYEPPELASGLPGCPSGQREQTVNLPAMPSEVRILLPAPNRIPFPASLAQSAERFHGKEEVTSSILVGGSAPRMALGRASGWTQQEVLGDGLSRAA